MEALRSAASHLTLRLSGCGDGDCTRTLAGARTHWRTGAIASPLLTGSSHDGRESRLTPLHTSLRWIVAAGQLAIIAGQHARSAKLHKHSGNGLRVGRRRVPSRIAVRVAIDEAGRRWETPVSWIGPSTVPAPADTDVQAKWAAGIGEMRVSIHHADCITALGWWEETICLATRGGLVRTVDLESGATIGEYYTSSHMPPAAVSALHFDGSAIVAGYINGKVNVWRAELPGSWGFTHSPDWVMEADDSAQAHRCAITDLALISGGTQLVSSDKDGIVAFWKPLGETRQVPRAHQVQLSSEVRCLCADGQNENAIYAGLANGTLARLEVTKQETNKTIEHKEEPVQLKEVRSFDAGISALTWDASSASLIVGLDNGQILHCCPESKDEPREFAELHGDGIRHLAMTMRAASPGTVPEVHHLLSTGADGRVGVWDVATGQPLWGLQGLSPDHLVALGDPTRLVTNGLVINPVVDPQRRVSSLTWKDPAPHKSMALPCEAVLCFDMLPSARPQTGNPILDEEPHWPAPEKQRVNVY